MTLPEEFTSRYTPPTEAQKDKEIEEALEVLENGFEILQTNLTLTLD